MVKLATVSGSAPLWSPSEISANAPSSKTYTSCELSSSAGSSGTSVVRTMLSPPICRKAGAFPGAAPEGVVRDEHGRWAAADVDVFAGVDVGVDERLGGAEDDAAVGQHAP